MDLGRRNIFLSASFPSGPRGEIFQPFDPAEIADAVTALVRAVLTYNGRLVFGGHPTITPLVLFVASEHRVTDAVDIYQSRFFADVIPVETGRLATAGFGRIQWVARRASLESSLREMRTAMIGGSDPLTGVFVGGMEGIVEEWELFAEAYPDRPRMAFLAPGGAARRLEPFHVPGELSHDLRSRNYPVAAERMIRYLTGEWEHGPAKDSPR